MADLSRLSAISQDVLAKTLLVRAETNHDALWQQRKDLFLPAHVVRSCRTTTVKSSSHVALINFTTHAQNAAHVSDAACLEHLLSHMRRTVLLPRDAEFHHDAGK